MKKLSIFIILSLSFCIHILAEKTTEGKEFWVSYYGFANEDSIPTVYPELEMYILVASKNGCSGNITNPNTGYSKPFTVTAGVVEKVIIDFDQCYSRSDGDTLYVANKGLFVTTSDTVSLYLGNYMNNSSDGSSVLPVSSLGNLYKIANYPQSNTSCFLVVATEDNTQIKFNLNDTIWDENTAQVMYLPDVDYVKTLNRGQTFLATGYNLIGSTVRSCKPIAIFAGDYGTSIPDPCYASDVLVEQVHPINTWGKEFLVNSIPIDSKVVVICKDDNTTVTIYKDGSSIDYPLNKDDYIEIAASLNGLYIEADKPIAVTQYASGRVCAGFGDPFMYWINPIEQNLNEIVFTANPSVNIGLTQIQIYTLTSNVNQTFLDGVNIGASFTPCLQNPLYSSAEYPILTTTTTHRLINDAGFTAYVYGFSFGVISESYGYSVGSSSYNIEDIYHITGYDGLSNNINFDTDSINNVYNPWDTITIDRNIQSVYDSVNWVLNGVPLFVPEENNQPQLTVNLPACRLKNGKNILGMIIYRDCMNDTIWTNLWLRKASFALLSIDVTICEGDSVQLFATTNIPTPEYIWYSKSFILTNHSANPFVSPIDTTKYYVYAAFGTYRTDMDSLIVSVKPKTYNAISESICPSDTYNFYGKILNVPGIYKDTLTNSLGCDSVVTLDLSFLPQETTYLSDSIDEGEFYLFGGDSLTISGIYTDIVSNVWNCDSTIILDLLVIARINPPNVFTPNGDGVNDRFFIKNINKFPNNSIKIFNRWGNIVYEAAPYQNNWEGFSHFGITIGGDNLPIGTYFYILNLGDGSKIKKGYVYLNR